ncbi:Pycsar system effector family protein [Cellulosimicrobium sp. SH8]|uniref:Pycsar system effector family protein n=1 Tax=Cellulosimicrobium sp. SH8 TaxID=2952936 RepID=UPI0021F32475|nr:Pycsar system effector family protein [Cellulosimicrobium sp. SH8]
MDEEAMRRRHRSTVEEEPSQGFENAWRIHEAQMDWTGKVDAKAAFALTVQAALLGAAVVLLPDMNTCVEYVLLGVSVIFVSAGAVCAALVVAPQLRSKSLASESASNFIYFGHVRLWKPEQLAREMRRTDLTEQLARQVTVMADIAWKKHRRVAWSIWLGLVGGAFLLAAAATSRI